MVRRRDTRTPSKPPLKTSTYQQDQTKWRSLIRRDAGEYEAKRTSKAEQNILFFIQIFTITNQRMLLTDFVKYDEHTLPVNPVSILRKSISGRHRPVRVADGPMTARYRFT